MNQASARLAARTFCSPEPAFLNSLRPFSSSVVLSLKMFQSFDVDSSMEPAIVGVPDVLRKCKTAETQPDEDGCVQ